MSRPRLRSAASWALVVCIAAAPVAIALFSPLQQSRSAPYVVGGVSGIVALALLLLQPLLVGGYLPGLRSVKARFWHHCIGCTIVLTVFMHIIGLYVTSPDDITDAMLFTSPTPFSVYGVLGFWCVVMMLITVVLRNRSVFSSRLWSLVHNSLALVLVGASVIHALLIEGAMGNVSKVILCVSVVIATIAVTVKFRIKRFVPKRSA